jgi:type IV pilus assembly protein PilC
MPRFDYQARNKEGKMVSGAIEAETKEKSILKLQSMSLFPIDLKESKGDGKYELTWAQLRGIKNSDITIFTRQLSGLLDSGVPLLKSLQVLKEQTENEKMLKVISLLHSDVETGATFSESLSKHPKIFTKLYANMVKAGEVGGLLNVVLDRLADFAEKEDELRSRIFSALAYPFVMIIVGIVAIFVLMTFVIPRFVGMFEEMEQDLPLLTDILIIVSDFMKLYWMFIIGGIAVAILILRGLYKKDESRVQIDRFLLRLPVFGVLIKKQEIARFSRTLGALLKNGVSILPSLDIVSETATNLIIRRAIIEVRKEVGEGEGLAEPMRKTKVFPPLVTNMIGVGEASGKIDEVLEKVAVFYEKDVDRTLKTLTSLIEPAIILALGLVVGFVVMAMLLPIFQLNALVQ